MIYNGNLHDSPQSFAALWQINNCRNPFSRRGSLTRGQRENVVGPTQRNAAIAVQSPCREQDFFSFLLFAINKAYF